MAQALDVGLVIRNAKISTMAVDPSVPAQAEAVYVRDGRIQAVGSDADVAAVADQGARTVDAGGRRVVPGLIDSHMHFVRAGMTWDEEVRWEDVPSLSDALGLLRQRVASVPEGAWVKVVGAWHPRQFAEQRGPTKEELDEVAPANPVFIQSLYSWGMLNQVGQREIGLDRALAEEIDAEAFDFDPSGEPSGLARGMQALSRIYGRLPRPSFDDQVRSTVSLSSHLAQYGLTCVVDGGGVNTGPTAYPAVYECWRQGALRTRVRITMHGTRSGVEPEEVEGILKYLTPHLGDDMLRVSAVGEIVLFSIHDRLYTTGDLSEGPRSQLRELFSALAEARWPVQVHAHQWETIECLLDTWEEVHSQTPIDGLRWSLIHAEGLWPEAIARLKALGSGVLLQSLFRMSRDDALQTWDEETIKEAPPLRQILEAGVPVGLGSDAMRAAPYNPFQTIRWFLDGRSLDGHPSVAEENLLSREEALRHHTIDAAWFTFDEDELGSLEPGKRADLAVLDRDILEAPTEEIPATRSVLTVVDGDVVWAAGELAGALPR